MRETIEMRVQEATARRFFEPGEGRMLGDDLRVIGIDSADPRLADIIRHQEKGRGGFFGWDIKRKYSRAELAAAEAFTLRISGVFEPAAEELDPGVYDDRDACPLRGTPRQQTRDLTLDLRRVSKRGGLARTIADEWIVDQQVADLLLDKGVTGVALRPVRHRVATGDETIDPERFPAGRELLARAEAEGLRHGSWPYFVWLNRPAQQELRDALHAQAAADTRSRAARKPPPPPWYQLIPDGPRARIIPPTLVGTAPYESEAQHERSRCPQGEVAGLNLLSELHLEASTFPALDLVATEQLVGTRRGLLQPTPLLVISPRLRDLFLEHEVKGWGTDVAYLA